MKINRKFLFICLTTIILFIIVVNYLSEIGSTYKFGIIADNYGNVIAKRSHYFAINTNVNRYSWYTPIILPDSDIKINIEHMITANQTDIRLIPEITDTRYLLTTIQCPDNKIISINIINLINGEPLSKKGIYLYSKSLSNNYRWNIKKINNSNNLNLQDKFEAISFVFPFPEKTSEIFIKIKKYLFRKAEQIITIEYLNRLNEKKQIEYLFKLDWYKYMSGWDKVATIT